MAVGCVPALELFQSSFIASLTYTRELPNPVLFMLAFCAVKVWRDEVSLGGGGKAHWKFGFDIVVPKF